MTRGRPVCWMHMAAGVSAGTVIEVSRIRDYPRVVLQFRGDESDVSLHIGLPEIAWIRVELNKAELELAVLPTGPDIREVTPDPLRGESDDV